MIVKVNTKLGGVAYQFEIDEKDEMETLNKMIVLGNPPSSCELCKSENVVFDTNKDKDAHIYINVKCNDCTAKAKLGRYTSGGYFWHHFEIYKAVSKSVKQSES